MSRLSTPVASPCNNVCRIDDRSGWCVGCHRSLDEIVAWSRMTDLQKRALCELLPARRAAAGRRDPSVERDS